MRISSKPTTAHCRAARHRVAAALACCLALLGGCASAPATDVAAVQPVAAPPTPSLEINVPPTATDAERRTYALLRRLVSLHEQGDLAAAAQIVGALRSPDAAGQLPIEGLRADARFHFDAIQLELALAQDDSAREDLERAATALLPTNSSQRRRADKLRVRVFAASSDHEQASLALMSVAERGLYADSAGLAAAIWRHLSKLPLPKLARLAAAATPSQAQWLRLGREMNAALTHAEQGRIWHRWRSRHGEHVAVRLPPPALERTVALTQLALLLPLTGDLAALAEAIRDGFLAAHLQTLQQLHGQREFSPAHRQLVRIYDTGALSVGEAFRRASADGMDVIVGPLEKAAVRELAALSPNLPVLALNSLDGEAPASSTFLQLTLAVEDAASAIASALQADGVGRIVLFDNQEAWSPRAETRLLAELGDIDVVAVNTLTGLDDVIAAAGEALGVNASNARHRELSRLLGEAPTFQPRLRQDVDAIVALVDGAQLTALKPALAFHFAGDLPLYGPPQAVRGANWALLDGMRVCAIPWLTQADALRTATAVFQASDDPLLAPLFALGVDAYRIVNQLPRLTTLGESLAGSVGMLTLRANGQIRRTLPCGTIDDGKLIAGRRP